MHELAAAQDALRVVLEAAQGQQARRQTMEWEHLDYGTMGGKTKRRIVSGLVGNRLLAVSEGPTTLAFV